MINGNSIAIEANINKAAKSEYKKNLYSNTTK